MIRFAQEKDIEDILRLLVQVNMVHHNIRPDLFNGPKTKYTKEELVGIINNPNTKISRRISKEKSPVKSVKFNNDKNNNTVFNSVLFFY